jgi:hypothetical protein
MIELNGVNKERSIKVREDEFDGIRKLKVKKKMLNKEIEECSMIK